VKPRMMTAPKTEAVATPGAACESRQEPRLSLFSDLHVCYEGEGAELEVHHPDLSTQGMFINTARHFPVGAVLQLRFRLHHGGGEIKTRAEVRYCLCGVGVGVEFIEMAPAMRRAIAAAIRSAAHSS